MKIMLTINGTIKTFKTITEACKALGLSPQDIMTYKNHHKELSYEEVIVEKFREKKTGKEKERLRHWTSEEDRFLSENAGMMTAEEIGKMLGRSSSAVVNRAIRKEVVVHSGSKPAGRKWTSEEDAFLTNNAGKMAAEEIGEKLNRTELAIKARAHQVGVSFCQNPSRKWEAADDDFLMNNAGKMTAEEIGKAIGRSRTAVLAHGNKIGISLHVSKAPIPKEIEDAPNSRMPWTFEEEKYLQDNAKDMTAKEIAAVLGRTSASVRLHASLNNISFERPIKVTEEKKRFILKNHDKMTRKELSNHLGIDKGTLDYHLCKLGIKKVRTLTARVIDDEYGIVPVPKIAEKTDRLEGTVYKTACRNMVQSPNRTRIQWTTEDDRVLRTRYPESSVGALAKEMGRTYGSVRKRLIYLGLFPACCAEA